MFQHEIKQQIRNLTTEQRAEIVERLSDKAQRILLGQYDPEDHPGDNYLWAGDLLRAAGLIQRREMSDEEHAAASISDCCQFDAMTQSEAEEIEAIGIDAILGV